MGRERDDAFGDAVYDAWRSGLDPDTVSRDRVCDDVDEGWDRFDAAEREVGRLIRDRKATAMRAEAEDGGEDD